MPVARAVGHVGIAVHDGAHGRGERRYRRFMHGDLDPLALAGALALDQRPQDAGAEMDAGQEVANGRTRLGRRSVGIAGGVGDAAHRLDGDVHGGKIAIGPVETEAGAAAVDQARVELAQHVPADAEAVHHAGGEVLDQHVGLGDKLEEDFPAARLLEVEDHRLLVGVQHDQRPGLDLALAAAHDVALRRLDLEHAGAHEAELQPAIGAVVDLPQIEDEHPIQWPLNGRACDGHGCILFQWRAMSMRRVIQTRGWPESQSSALARPRARPGWAMMRLCRPKLSMRGESSSSTH